MSQILQLPQSNFLEIFDRRESMEYPSNRAERSRKFDFRLSSGPTANAGEKVEDCPLDIPSLSTTCRRSCWRVRLIPDWTLYDDLPKEFESEYEMTFRWIGQVAIRD